MIRTNLSVAIALLALSGCGQAPEPSPTAIGRSDLPQNAKDVRRPEITAGKIAADIIGKKLSIPELHGDGPDEQWIFDASEFLQVNIQEKTDTRAGETFVAFVVTRSNPAPNQAQIHVAGKLELQYEWKADKWVLATIRNLTVRYTASGPA